MKATRVLQKLGQSLWLDNITRGLLKTGRLRRYIDEFSVTGLTSNPTIFDHAIRSGDYDDAIKSKLAQGTSGEQLLIELALEDLTQAADLFGPIHDQTCGVDGWVCWKSRRCWRTTPNRRLPRPRISTRERSVPTS